MKVRFLAPIVLLSASLTVTIPLLTSCKSSQSELYFSYDGENFLNEITSDKFRHDYVSDKGKPLNYSDVSTTDSELLKKVNSLITAKDMVFLMAYDVIQMFDNDRTVIAKNCSNVSLRVDKSVDDAFSVAEYWTDKSYVWDGKPDDVGANCVAHTLNDTRIQVSEVGKYVSGEQTPGTWKITFSPIADNSKLSIDHYSLPGNEKTHSSSASRDFFTWTLPLYAAELLFPSWEFPVFI